MGPRTEFVALATLSGALVTLLGYLAASQWVFGQPLAEGLRTAAKWSPSGAMAACASAWLATAWLRRALARGRRWSATGMATRATLMALLLYPVTVAAWVLLTGLFDQRFAAAPMAMHELLAWVPSIVFGATLAAVVAGTLPAFAIAFLLCRRYLRRGARSTTDIA
jgi:hypothetical protein